MNERAQVDAPDFVKQLSAVTSQISNLTKSLSTDLPVAVTNPVDDENSNTLIFSYKIDGISVLFLIIYKRTHRFKVLSVMKHYNLNSFN